DWTPASQFVEQVIRDTLLHDRGGFALINRAVDNRPLELLRLDPRHVDPKVGDYSEPYYSYTPPVTGGERPIRAADVVHIRASSLDGVRSVSPISQGREAIALALLLEQHCARLFANSAKPSGVIRMKGKLVPQAVANIKASWVANHGGVNSG